MEKIIITGVPEHFNFPWLQLVEEQPFLSDHIQLVWENESRGSGAMNSAIREENADIAIVLTESFLKDKIEGNPGKIIGFHVKSPLVWGIHVPVDSRLTAIGELKNIPFLVSRIGSGSHLMAHLLARNEGWDRQELDFEIVGNLDGAINAFKKNNPKAFLWEKYTTQPLVDKGIFRRIGEIPTPWPCFVMVASVRMLKDKADLLAKIKKEIYRVNQTVMNDKKKFIVPISEKYLLSQAGVAAWLAQTNWATNDEFLQEEIDNTLEVIMDIGLINKKLALNKIIYPLKMKKRP
jgi:ABC-type nitrate/sulfonate/bicarbonate transport system substrate-binding protein